MPRGTDPAPDGSVVGRGAAEGAQLVRDWFATLTGTAERGERAAYVFVMGSLAELLRTFDLPIVFPEINALQTAVRRVAHEYLSEAEDYGYSPDVCAYVKADVALQLRRGEHPMGRIPAPALAVATTACATYIKWAEIWQRLYDVPVFVLDVPGSRTAADAASANGSAAHDVAYVTKQIGELIALCERITGRAFDVDRLRERLQHANAMTAGFRRLAALNTSVPAPFDAVTDGTIYLGVANALRGTAEGAAYMARLVEEMTFKVEHRLGTAHDERNRLMFVGVPCYPMFRRFHELFVAWGGVFVTSTYLWFASGGADLGHEYDVARPIESLAEGLLRAVGHATDSMLFPDRAVLASIAPFHVDGVVYHGVKSCRTVSTGLSDARRAVAAARDVPSLFIESDMMDRRVVSEAQLKNRIDAFFEGLRGREAAASSRS